MNRLTFARLNPQPGEQLLEIGFGGGDLLSWALVAGSDAVGVDVSDAMVARAIRRFRRELSEGRVRLFAGSVESLPLAAASIDKACSVNNIYFWPDPQAAMAELARVVRPGGTLAICFEPPEELRKWPGHRFGFRLYEATEVARLMEDAGFGGIEAAEGSGRKPDRFLCLSGTRLGANG